MRTGGEHMDSYNSVNFVNSAKPFGCRGKDSSKKIKKSIAYGFHFDNLRAPRRPQGQQDSMLADR